MWFPSQRHIKTFYLFVLLSSYCIFYCNNKIRYWLILWVLLQLIFSYYLWQIDNDEIEDPTKTPAYLISIYKVNFKRLCYKSTQLINANNC